jgi:hypothetical protein
VLAYADAFNRGDEHHAVFTDDELIYGVLGWGVLDQVVSIWREINSPGESKATVN